MQPEIWAHTSTTRVAGKFVKSRIEVALSYNECGEPVLYGQTILNGEVATDTFSDVPKLMEWTQRSNFNLPKAMVDEISNKFRRSLSS